MALATKTYVNDSIDKFVMLGAEYIDWTKDGPSDSDKVTLKVSGKEYMIAVEKAQFNVASMNPFKWNNTKFKSPKEVMKYINA